MMFFEIGKHQAQAVKYHNESIFYKFTRPVLYNKNVKGHRFKSYLLKLGFPIEDKILYGVKIKSLFGLFYYWASCGTYHRKPIIFRNVSMVIYFLSYLNIVPCITDIITIHYS